MLEAMDFVYFGMFFAWAWAVNQFVLSCMVNYGRPKEQQQPDVVLGEWHHGYLGDITFWIGLVLGWLPLILLGFWWRMDDTYQHTRQLKEAEYRSPWARWFGKYMWNIPGVPQLAAFMDRLVAWVASKHR